MGTPKSPMSLRIWGNTNTSLAHPSPMAPTQAHPSPAATGPSPRTRPGKKRLFLNLRRKKAMKKVPAMSTSESSAVLGCPVTLVAPRAAGLVARAVVLATATLPLPQASAELLVLRQPCSGCSWKI